MKAKPQACAGQRKQQLVRELEAIEKRTIGLDAVDWELFSQDLFLELISILKKG